MHLGASRQEAPPGALPPTPAETLTALVTISETTSSTVSAVQPSPHSPTINRACSRAHGTARGRTAVAMFAGSGGRASCFTCWWAGRARAGGRPGAEEAEDLGRLWRRLIVAIMVQLIKG